MYILQINTSIRGIDSYSSLLADKVVSKLIALTPHAKLDFRDLAQKPIPELNEDMWQGLTTTPDQCTPQQIAGIELNNQLINDIMHTDFLVLAVPMYNFGIPSQLKNWIDAICRPRVTFRYTENGSEGLIKVKKAFVVLTRGGTYRGTDKDIPAAQLQATLEFLGIRNVHWIYAENLSRGETAVESAFNNASSEIEAITLE